jgi:thiol-disulfide isomerase/thioredoxin
MNDVRAEPRPRASRRAWLWGAGAAALGVGWLAASRLDDAGRAAARASDDDAIWTWTLTRPDGSPLSLASLRATGLVLNFWATWCPPCLREFPQLDRFERDMKARGWRVLGVAVDQPGAVRDFLAKTPVSFAIGIGGFDALEKAKMLGNAQGGLPFTVVFAPGGRIVKTILGETTRDALVSIVDAR